MAGWLHFAVFTGILLMVGGQFPDFPGGERVWQLGYTFGQAVSELQPNNPVVDLGDTLVLTCTMHARENFSASDIYFKIGPTLVLSANASYVTVIDSLMSELRLPATAQLNQAFVQCILRPPERNIILGIQVVTVIFPLTVPNITQCIVRNSSMMCEWSPTEDHHTKNVSKRIIHHFSWKLKGDPMDSWRDCPEEPKVGACVWPRTVFTNDAVYLLSIHAGYQAGHHNVTANFTINSANIVQVDPVDLRRLTVNHLRTSSVRLEWAPVHVNMGAIYRVNVTHDSPQYASKSMLLDTNHVTIYALKPYQPYRISLEAKTREYGYWSETVKKEIFSMSDVPARNPEVKPGGFSTKEVTGDPCVELTLYWKEIAEQDEHGPEFRYEVDVAHDGSCGRECASRAQRPSHVTVNVPSTCTVNVTVKSRNINGTATVQSEPVRIEPTSKRTPGPSNITVIASVNTTTVTVRWNNEPNDTSTTGYTVYWCNHLTFACDKEINWEGVAANIHQVVLHLAEAFSKYEFAVSREEVARTSGMVLSDCTYEKGQYSPPPENFHISKNLEAGNGEVALEWREPQCHTHRGFVYGYLITYCEVENAPSTCPADYQKTLMLSVNHTNVLLTGLTEHALYCVTISSMTAKGPSKPSSPHCVPVSGSWWTYGRIIGVTIGCILALVLVIFGIIKFGSKCHKYYSKFQQGLPVVLPHTSYSTQFSVSSSRGLIDQNNSFIYSIEDYSSPGLAKQHSHESTADSGRGSMTHDHIHPPIHRSTSRESDEVFLGKNAPLANGNGTRTRQLSEPMSSYARIMHNSGPDRQSASMVSLGTPILSSRPKLPLANKTPLKDASPGSTASSMPQSYNMSSPGSIPSYVMVGGNSQTGEDYSLNENSCNTSQISDYTKADGENPSTNGGVPLACVTPPETTNDEKPLGYVTFPEASNQGVPLGFIPAPEEANQDAPLGYVTAPEAAYQGAPLGYITPSEAVDQGVPLGYVTGPEVAKEEIPLAYIVIPEAANHGAPLDYITAPDAINQGAPLGYITAPEVLNQGDPLGYVTAPETSNQGCPLDYVTAPDAANQGAPLGYVTAPDAANQGAPLGYVASPELTNFDYVTNSDLFDQGKAPPPGSVACPNILHGSYNNSNDYISNSDPDFGCHVTPVDGGIGSPDYVRAEDVTPAWAVSTPLVTSSNSRFPLDQQSAVTKQQCNSYQPYVSLPPLTTDSKCNGDVACIPPNKELSGWNSDANHNDVTNSGSYVRPPDMKSPLGDCQSDALEDTDETCSLLPSDGGRKVLNKSGYIVVDT